MQSCKIYHTGIVVREEGIIKDNKLYFIGKDDELLYPENIFMAREECEDKLIQFEVKGKWGFANIETGEIIIKPIWDYAGPFYSGYSHAVLESKSVTEGTGSIDIVGGKHGYINTMGTVIIPLEYEDAYDIPYIKHFQVKKNGKWGLIDNENRVLIPFQWYSLQTTYSHNLIFASIKDSWEFNLESEDILKENDEGESRFSYKDDLKWAIYNADFNFIIEPVLDEEPFRPMIKSNPLSKSFGFYDGHLVLKKDDKFGLICNDGSLIANIEFSKDEVAVILNDVSGRDERDLYI